MTETFLEPEARSGTFVGRAFVPGDRGHAAGGPCVIVVRDGLVHDATGFGPTCSALLERPDYRECLDRAAAADPIGDIDDLFANSIRENHDAARPWLLAPFDLQCIKAAGVTFVSSMLERVIEERAGGDPVKARDVRKFIVDKVGADISRIRPGSTEADALKQVLIDEGVWSQYLEVGIGPYAEVFTKAPVLSAVGFGAEIGIHPESSWNNPEPEIVLVVTSRSEVRGVTLGNDVNLRDFEGRSALLLGKAKDNNASCAAGPLIRVLDDGFGDDGFGDDGFGLDDVRRCDVTLRVDGDDGFSMEGVSSMSAISRDILDLVDHAAGANHQYPDGFVLFTGTLFSPTKDRDKPGMGFTHHMGDRVAISAPALGTLLNHVTTSDRATPWTFGISALMANLRDRSLL